METQYKHLKARTSYKNLSFDLLLYFFCRSVLLQTSNSTSDIPFFSNCCSVSSYKYKLEQKQALLGGQQTGEIYSIVFFHNAM